MTHTYLPCETHLAEFEATTGRDTLTARNLCRQCPKLAWCVGERRRAAEDGTLRYFEGTWAGKLYRGFKTREKEAIRRGRGIPPRLPKDVVDERHAAWLALHEQGVALSEIGRRFGVHHTTVRSAIRKAKGLAA